MFKICPSCGDEFVQHIVECPDCHVPLTAQEIAGPAPLRSAADSAERRALDAAVLLRRGSASELRQLSERLDARGVRFVVDTDPPGGQIAAAQRGAALGREVQLAVYAEEADAAEATLAVREWLLALIPDAPAAPAGAFLDSCPGCSEPLSASASACASCGLEFPPLEVACPQCGQPVATEAERCPHCSYRP